MKTVRTILAAVVVFALGAYLSYAMQPAPSRSKAETPPKMFEATSFPADTSDRPYHEHVTNYLNRMAARGWMFKTAIVGQPQRVMIFERRTR
jgi:hypothetical protein